MSISLPAIRGQMGDIEYFSSKMRVTELTNASKPACEAKGWSELKMDERIQRELNNKRVRDEIIPYLVKSKDRFFNSILVLAQDPDMFEFETLQSLVAEVPVAYRSSVEDMGVLTIDGGQFVILDGQHRWAALRGVISPDPDEPTIIGPYSGDVSRDELTVVFVKLDTFTARRVFSKINKHAKSTSRADNILISEDDGYAIVTRSLLGPGAPLGMVDDKEELLVNWKTNTLTPTSKCFTTISALYEATKEILGADKGRDFADKRRVVRPSDEELDRAYAFVEEWWKTILSSSRLLSGLIESYVNLPEHRGNPDDPVSLLTRPAMHIVIVKALVLANKRGVGLELACSRLDKVDWAQSSDLWRDFLVTPGRNISARMENYRVSAELLAYLVGSEALNPDDLKTLETDLADYRGLLPATANPAADPSDQYRLPPPILS